MRIIFQTCISCALIFILQQAKAQCFENIYSIPDSMCLAESIQVSGEINLSNLIVDLCPNDLDSSPTLISQDNIQALTRPRGMKIISDDGNIFAFVTGRDNNVLVRLDYGNSLENTPLVTNLGNVNNLLSNPESIDIIKSDGNWYGFIHNTNGNALSLVKLNFGDDLTNTPSASILLSAVGGPLTKINNIEVNGEVFLILTYFSENKLRILNLGDLSATEIKSDFTTDVLPGTNQIVDLKLIKRCGIWQGVLSCFNNRTIKWIEFNNGLLANPDVTDITSGAFTSYRPISVEVMNRGKDVKLLVSTLSGALLKGNYNPEMTSPSVSWDLETQVSSNIRFSQLFREDSKWFYLMLSESESSISRLLYQNQCDANFTISSLENIDQIRYSSSGKKYIQFTGTTPDGSSYVDLDSIYYYRPSQVSISTTKRCLAEVTAFTSEVIADVPGMLQYAWEFGDNTNSSEQNPFHQYTSEGDYEVVLNVTDGCSAVTQYSTQIHIFPEDNIFPDFAPPDLICQNSLSSFEDLSMANNENIVAWQWSVDGLQVSIMQDPSIIFQNAGTATVMLEATGESGCTNSITKSVDILQSPTPSFTFDDACQGASIHFTNSSTGEITTHAWDFGNGVTSTIKDPIIQYDLAGQYIVTLTESNSAGCEVSTTQNITIYQQPQASFTNDLACQRTPVTFVNTSISSDANIVSSSWDFGDPGSEGNLSDEMQPTHTFSAAGQYLVTLTTKTNFGCESVVTQTVDVNESPTAAFSIGQACVGDPVQFQDASFGTGSTSITSWAWDLGGTFSNQRNPVKTFNFPLDYDITLTVTGSNQCTASTTQVLTIFPEPDLAIGYEQPCTDTPTRFTDLTPAGPGIVVSRLWDFGGLGQSTDSLASFTFPNTGSFLVTLTQEISDGCTYSLTQSVMIDELPQVSFTLDSEFGPPPFSVHGTNTSSEDLIFYWYLDGILISDERDLNYQIDEPGNYMLTLTGRNSIGCEASASSLLQVIDPQVDLGISELILPSTSNDRIRVTLTNYGNIQLNSVWLSFLFGNSYETRQQFVVDLPPGGNPVQLEIPWLFSRSPYDAFCVSLPDSISGVPDRDPDNNSVCYSAGIVSLYPPYPNPAGNEIRFLSQASASTDMILTIFNSRGEQVKALEQSDLPVGSKEWIIDTSGFAAGVYILRASSGDIRQNYRFVIQR